MREELLNPSEEDPEHLDEKLERALDLVRREPNLIDRLPSVLAQIDASLHPDLFRYMIQQRGVLDMDAVVNVRAFEGVDVREGLKMAIEHGLGDWLIGVTKRFPEMDVLALVDDLIARKSFEVIYDASSSIDVSLHDAIAQKLIEAGEPFHALFDSYHNADFHNLSIEVVAKAYERSQGREGSYNKSWVQGKSKGAEVFRDYMLHKDRFVGDDREYLSFWLARGYREYVAAELKKFQGNYGRENSLELLKVERVGSVFPLVVQQAQVVGYGEEQDPERISTREILAMFWDAKEGKKMIVGSINYFFEDLRNDRLRELIRDGFEKQVAEMLIDMGDRETVEEKRALGRRMFRLGLHEYVVQHINKFKHAFSDDELANMLLRAGAYETLAKTLGSVSYPRRDSNGVEIVRGGFRAWYGRFLDVDKGMVAQRFIEVGEDALLAKYLQNFDREFKEVEGESDEDRVERRRAFDALPPAVDHEALARRLMRQFDARMKAWEETPEHERTIVRPQFLDSPLATFYGNFKNLSYATTLEMIRRGAGYTILDAFRRSPTLLMTTYIPQPQATEVMELLFETGQADVVAANMDLFDETFNRNAIARRIWDEGFGYHLTLTKNLDRFSGLDQRLARDISENRERALILMKHESSFARGFDRETCARIVDFLLGGEKLIDAISFNDTHGKPNRVLGELYDAFGGNFSGRTYAHAKGIFDGTEGVRFPGVEHSGAAGLKELFARLRTLRHRFNVGDIDVDAVIKDDFVADWLMQTVGYRDSQWGEHTMESFRDLVVDYRDLSKRGEIAPLPVEYQGARAFVVKKKRGAEMMDGDFVYSEGFLVRYCQLLDSVRAAQQLADEDMAARHKRANGLRALIDEFKEIQTALLADLDEKRHGVADRARERGGDVARAVEGIIHRIRSVEHIDIDAMDHPQELFARARQFREFDEVLRRIMFYFTFRYGEGGGVDFSSINRERPSSGDISVLIDFVDHVTNRETLGPLFTDVRAQKEFRGLLNVAALQDEYQRMSAQESGGGGVREVRMRCQRNLLTEFSGHIGDACWANKIASILKEYPNFVSFTLEQNPDDPRTEKLVGAGFLIETESADGEPVLVVRGNNPQLSFIDQVDALDFVLEQFQRFGALARARGRALCVVIDYVGGAGTNRQGVQWVYEVFKNKFEKVRLKSNVGTLFNGYDIRQITYRVNEDDIHDMIAARKKR